MTPDLAHGGGVTFFLGAGKGIFQAFWVVAKPLVMCLAAVIGFGVLRQLLGAGLRRLNRAPLD